MIVASVVKMFEDVSVFRRHTGRQRQRQEGEREKQTDRQSGKETYRENNTDRDRQVPNLVSSTSGTVEAGELWTVVTVDADAGIMGLGCHRNHFKEMENRTPDTTGTNTPTLGLIIHPH